MKRASRLALLLGFTLGLAAGCRRAEVLNYCLEDQSSGDCPPCSSDSQCHFTGNACTDTVLCAHRDASIAVVDLGCDEAIEYSWPDPEECACVDSICQYADE